ncbi:glycosyltransferase family 4 protein [Pseudobutyrivibrio sp.]|uniref:glycosyltransferase family 4 protein n=1 Tax=Pseudobutyrivibrio sp. TaxID=2014367 RepID=UPI001D8B24C6|nr:glycosyltransferase family 4 protein [Pseudobutyrivibrio sp.]MBE5910643.1 glycosyltransferase family 4 protein [Pseudobutyrivibrio sp.]
MKKMRILYILHESVFGGATKSFLDFIDYALSFINPIIVIPSEGPVTDILKKKGYKVFVIPFLKDFIPLNENGNVKLLMNDNIQAAKKIVRIIAKEKIELIHTNSSVANVGALASCYANIPHVWHFRELVERQFDYKYYDNSIKKRIVDCSDLVIAISECVRKEIDNRFQLKSSQLYNAVTIESEHLNTIEERMLNEFIFIGYISKNKGQCDAVRAVNELVSNGVDVKVYLVGAGNYRSQWAINKYIKYKGLNNNIIIIGFTENLQALRNRCRFAIIGSEYEALGRVTIEAMLSGNIPIGVNSAGTKEIIGEHQENGYLYEFGDYIQLARIMKNLTSMSLSEYKKVSHENYCYARKKFSVENYTKQLIDLYSYVVTHKENKVEQKRQLVKYLYNYSNIDCVSSNVEANGKNDVMEAGNKDFKENVLSYLNRQKVHYVAIYGMSKFGCDLYDVLEEHGYEITNIFDKQPDIMESLLPYIHLSDELDEKTEVIIVTLKNEEDKVISELRNYYSVPIIGRSILQKDIHI